MQPGFEWWRVVLLIAIFAFLGGAWWWVNRGKISWKNLGKIAEPRIKLHEQRWISHQLTLYLVEVEGSKFLLARTQQGVAWQPLPPSAPVTEEKKT